MSVAAADLTRRRGSYGVDAPYVLTMLTAGAAIALVVAVAGFVGGAAGWAIFSLISAVYLFLSAASFAYTTRSGKFVVWANLLRELPLRDDERALDMGCGRGAILVMVAKLLPNGRAVGLDLWKSMDQSGNAPEVTLRNAELEGVRDRVELVTGDMTSMPFEDGSFDLVVSSLAIHNIKETGGREKAIDEAVRVLNPGGRLRIVDFRSVAQYAERLRHHGMLEIQTRDLGWRFWYGGPWTASRLVSATKPA